MLTPEMGSRYKKVKVGSSPARLPSEALSTINRSAIERYRCTNFFSVGATGHPCSCQMSRLKDTSFRDIARILS